MNRKTLLSQKLFWNPEFSNSMLSCIFHPKDFLYFFPKGVYFFLDSYWYFWCTFSSRLLPRFVSYNLGCTCLEKFIIVIFLHPQEAVDKVFPVFFPKFLFFITGVLIMPTIHIVLEAAQVSAVTLKTHPLVHLTHLEDFPLSTMWP